MNKYKEKEKVQFYNPLKMCYEEGIIRKVNLIIEHKYQEHINKYEYAIEYDPVCYCKYVLEEDIKPL